MPENKKKRTYEEVQAEVNSKLKEKKAYQARIKTAINHIKDDPEKINKLKKYLEDRTKGSTDINGYCISSACYTLNEAKELLSYVSGTNLQKDIVSGKLPGWKIDYDLNNLEEGDILQQDRINKKGGRGAPFHTMLTENVGKDESGNVTDIKYFGSSGSAESFDSHDIERSTIDKFKKDKNYQIIKKEFVPNSLLRERDMLKPFVKPRVEKYKDYVPNEQIKYLGSNDESEDKKQNREKYINKMMGRKEELMKAYNLSNNEYNDLVKLSAGILDQESEYGTSTRYKLKNIPGVQFAGKWIKGETLEALDLDEYSVGPGQSKPKYFPSKAGEKFGITPESEEATLITVLDRYSNQVPSNLKGTPAGYLKTANVYKGMSSDYNEYAQSVLDKAASFGFPNYNEGKTSFIDIKNKEREKKQEVMKQSFAPVVNQDNFVNVKKEPTIQFKNGGVLRVTDKNAPELKAYNDSLSNYNKNEILWRGWQPVTPGNAEQLNTFYEPNKVYRERTDPNLPGYDVTYKNVVKKPVRKVILEDKSNLETIKPLGIKPMETSVEAKLAGNVEVPTMSNTKGVTQNYTGSKALQIQGKPSGYTNKGDRTGRQEFRKGGWLDGIPSIKPNFQTIWDTDKDILEFRRVFKERFGEEPGTEDGGVYNIQEAVMNGERPRLDKSDGLYHWSDKYKLPDHPTFSNQSKYYKPGMKAVKWVNEEPVNIETQNYTGSKALKIQGKSTGYVNIGDGTGRKEVKKFGGWLDGLEEGKTEQAPDVTNATEYIKNWYNSPMYGNILRNQIADAGIKSPKRTERIVKRFSKNFNQDLNNSFYDITPNLVDDPTHYGRGILDYKGGRKIELNKNFVETSPKLVNSLFAHELTHDNLMTNKDIEYVAKNTPEYNPAIHDEKIYNTLTDPAEVRSQIHSIRQLSGENKIYDPLTQPFKKEYLDKVNESYNQGTKDSENYNQLQRLRKYYSDDQITEMMNTISKSNSNDGKVYARNGGLLNSLSKQRFDMGGTVDEGESGDILPSWDKVKATLNPYNWGVDDYTKSGTRNQAFNAARKAGEKEFMWNNQRYNTRKDTDPIPYIGNNPNQEKYDATLRKEYPEFFKTLNRGKNVGSITWEGHSDEQPNRASINTKQTNSNINAGKNPETSHEFIGNMIAESSHLKDPKLGNNIFSAYDWKTRIERKRHDENVYNIPGATEYDDHRLIEPGMAMIAYGNLSPKDIKRIQSFLGVTQDGYFGPQTYKALQNKYKDNPYIKESLLFHQNITNDKDKNPISMGRYNYLAKEYLKQINKDVPLKQHNRFTSILKKNVYSDEALKNSSAEDMDIVTLQEGLSARGYNLSKSTKKNGRFDGVYGDETKKALLDYQAKNAKSKLKNGGWLDSLDNNKFDMGGVLDGLDGVDKGTQVPDATATAKPVVNLNFAITPAQKQQWAKNKRQAEIDMQVDYPEFYTNSNFLDKKAVKPYSVEDYKKYGIKEPGLQTSMDPIDLVGSGVYKGVAKALGAKEVAVAADAALFNSLDKSKVLYNQVKTKAKDEIYKLKYKKDIASLESKKFNAMQKMNNPEGWKRLREQGIEPKQFFDQLNKSKITSTRDIGSFDNGAQINIDFNQVKRLKKEGYDLSVDDIIDHEIGHRMQRGFNSKAVNDYNQAKSYNYRHQVPKQFMYSTPLDKEAELLLSPVIKNPNKNSDYFLFGSSNKERLPFLREAKESMVSKGFINNIYSKITPETVKKFLKEVPSNRFSTFLDVENPITHRRLSGLLNKTPIVAGAGLGVNELAKDKKQNGGWLDNLK